MLEDISINKLINDLDKKIKEANSGMRVASPSVVISLNMAMNIRRALAKVIEEDEFIICPNCGGIKAD